MKITHNYLLDKRFKFILLLEINRKTHVIHRPFFLFQMRWQIHSIEIFPSFLDLKNWIIHVFFPINITEENEWRNIVGKSNEKKMSIDMILSIMMHQVFLGWKRRKKPDMSLQYVYSRLIVDCLETVLINRNVFIGFTDWFI